MTGGDARTTAIANGLLRAVRFILSQDERPWADAILSELDAIESRREQLRVALSATRGLVAISVERQIDRWAMHSSALAIAVSLGLVTAAIDLLSESRWPLRAALFASCAVVGLFTPPVARVGGFLVGLGLPLMIGATGFHGPYGIDRADAWWPVLPCVLLASCFGAARLRFLRR